MGKRQETTGRRSRARRILRGALLRLAILGLGLGILGCVMFSMPGRSIEGPLAPLERKEEALVAELRRDVERLAAEIGPRHLWRLEALRETERFLAGELERAGYAVEREVYEAQGKEVANLYVELPGDDPAAGSVIVGAHYDTDASSGTPGADDNASGVAALLAIARRLAGAEPRRTLRLVFFVNEEAPFFQGPLMGSHVHAAAARARGERIRGMLSLESIGYYDLEPGSQNYPFPLSLFYPDRGDFLGFVGSLGSRGLVRDSIGAFRRSASLPSEGGAVPAWIPGVGYSDHWSFWQFDYDAAMLTGTAPFRNPHYHRASDTADTLDYERLARATAGIEAVVRELAGAGR